MRYRWYRVKTELYAVTGSVNDGWTNAVWDVWATDKSRAASLVLSTPPIHWEGRNYQSWIDPAVKSMGRELHTSPVYVRDIVKPRPDIAKKNHDAEIKKES